MTMLAGALQVARYYPVFVVSPNKQPLANCPSCRTAGADHDRAACACLTCHGFYAATRNPSRIMEMVARHPGGMLAIRTGAVDGRPLGPVVIDVDPRNGGNHTLAAIEAERLLPGTLTTCTGGDGVHFWYRHPGGILAAGTLGPGIDVKADDGYVVVPPSRALSGGQYRWVGSGDVLAHPLTPLPGFVLDRLRGRPSQPRPRPHPAGEPAVFADVRARLIGVVAAALRAQVGERNSLLHWTGRRVAEMVADGSITDSTAVGLLVELGLTIGLTPSEVGDGRRGTVGSALRAGCST